jgi:hypothetical protein
MVQWRWDFEESTKRNAREADKKEGNGSHG